MGPCERKNSTSPFLSKDGAEKIAASATEHDKCGCFEGERLTYLLTTIGKEVESERCKNKVLPDKLWFKQQFAIGVNEVTRLLERMHSVTESNGDTHPVNLHAMRKGHHVNLQAVLVASDCNPRWLTKHLPTLATSRNVPLIHVKDKREGSLRLGELVKLKTAIAIGVKAKGSSINQTIQKILCGDGENCGEEKSIVHSVD